ncbi:hypothetical protein EOPP23_21035 [Endozoicomonas sp. OPT23]|uniref:hypothetical protein n=1 Tax=Endozoicomonas sp. OPT23 TaxID=2072845 RepID=UPI00129BB5CD|nr:hypothetical protein [Endozoicomonas sp. OPT23]MRI35449.1 hypothetical protein [Endozoicomonas sp. OPT23]
MPSPKTFSYRLFKQSNAFSLRIQLMLLFGFFFSALAISTCFLVYSQMKSANDHQADTIGNLLSSQTAKAATNMMVTGDRLGLSVLLGQLVQNPYVARAAIFSIDNREIASAESDKIGKRGESFSSPVHYQDVIAGYVRLQLDEKLLRQNPNDALTLIIGISGIMLLSGLLLIHVYVSGMVSQVSLIERQLHTILQAPANQKHSRNELVRLSALVEQQLTEKMRQSSVPEQAEEEEKEETAAIVSIRTKNLNRLRQLLSPNDLVTIVETHIDAIERAADEYEGEISYTPDGTCFIRFSSLDSDSFAVNALSCALLVEYLNRVVDEKNIASLEMGLGFCLSDGILDFPGEEHPFQSDSAAGNAMMLASLPDINKVYMLREQLNWLPKMPEVKAFQEDEDIVEVVHLDNEQTKAIQQQAYDISRDMERA